MHALACDPMGGPVGALQHAGCVVVVPRRSTRLLLLDLEAHPLDQREDVFVRELHAPRLPDSRVFAPRSTRPAVSLPLCWCSVREVPEQRTQVGPNSTDLQAISYGFYVFDNVRGCVKNTVTTASNALLNFFCIYISIKSPAVIAKRSLHGLREPTEASSSALPGCTSGT